MPARCLSLLILIVTAGLLAGCGGSKPKVQGLPSQEGEWIKARKEYDSGNYVKAIDVLSAYVEAYPGSRRLDEALLLLGLSRQKTRDNLVAVEDFNRLIRDFPQSPHREQAEFERAQCYLADIRMPARDPEATENSLSLLRAYLERYPDGAHAAEAREGIDLCLELLATKAFLNARTYLRMKQDHAAALYLEKALRTKPDFSRAGEAMAILARARERLGRRAEARKAWLDLLDFATAERIERNPGLARLREEGAAAIRRLPPPEENAP